MTTTKSILDRLTKAVSGTEKKLFTNEELNTSSQNSTATNGMRTRAMM
jgi:hypothetical protein